MPSLVENEDNAGCFRGAVRGDHLPSVSSIVSPRNVSINGDRRRQLPSNSDHLVTSNKEDSADNTNKDIALNMNGLVKHDTRTTTSLALTGSSVHFKLPVIDLPKSYKVNDGITHKQDQQKILYRGKHRSLIKPLSYLSNVDEITSHPNEHETANFNFENVSDDAVNNNRHGGSHIMFSDDSHVSTLPNIFHKGNLPNASLVRASIKSNNTAGNSRDDSWLSFKRESSITSMSGQDLSLVGRRSTLCHRAEANVLQKSRTHVSPLLLPISVYTHPSVFARKQRKGDQTANK